MFFQKAFCPMFFFLSGFVFFNFSFADGTQAPPPFAIEGKAEKAIFVDFKSAIYDITFDAAKKETRVHSVIQFSSPEAGLPVFELSDTPTQISLDGETVAHITAKPADDAQEVRVVLKTVTPGDHVLIVDHILVGGFMHPTFGTGQVNSGFFMLDDEGDYLQNYLPSTNEFSQYQMTMNVKIVGAEKEHTLFANGEITQTDPSAWTVKFPSHYNTSAVYFHLIPTDQITLIKFTFDNGDGPVLNGVAYQKVNLNEDLQSYVDETLKSLVKLNADYGKFPHSNLILYNPEISGGGGMEYAGATVSAKWAIVHELAHSYFGRGVMPANGNAGWIDEAMATIASNLPYNPDPQDLVPIGAAAHSAYFTENDGSGYRYGMNFLTYLSLNFEKTNPKLTLQNFLKTWLADHNQQTVTTEILQKDLEKFGGVSLQQEFDQYIYNKTASKSWGQTDPYLKISKEQLQKIQ